MSYVTYINDSILEINDLKIKTKHYKCPYRYKNFLILDNEYCITEQQLAFLNTTHNLLLIKILNKSVGLPTKVEFEYKIIEVF